MRVKVYKDQSTIAFDTLRRQDPCIVIIQAMEATPVFIDQERANLDGNVDAGGNPQGGIFLTNAAPPLVLLGAKCVLWCRAGASTFLEVQVLEQRIEVTASPRTSTHQPVQPQPEKRTPVAWHPNNFANRRQY